MVKIMLFIRRVFATLMGLLAFSFFWVALVIALPVLKFTIRDLLAFAVVICLGTLGGRTAIWLWRREPLSENGARRAEVVTFLVAAIGVFAGARFESMLSPIGKDAAHIGYLLSLLVIYVAVRHFARSSKVA
ncbi:hypothetical protein [Paraburkholderia sp. Clong3]|uniref:hypothetical protein n=1 Tax=Paraburkholderia sp. Clong3 TaxID=2991061 RepID=UPI003D245FF1